MAPSRVSMVLSTTVLPWVNSPVCARSSSGVTPAALAAEPIEAITPVGEVGRGRERLAEVNLPAGVEHYGIGAGAAHVGGDDVASSIGIARHSTRSYRSGAQQNAARAGPPCRRRGTRRVKTKIVSHRGT